MIYSKENLGAGLSALEVADLVNAQNELLNDTITKLALKNDAALSRATLIAPPIISKLRSGNAFLHSAYQVTIHELTGWSIEAIKKKLGLPTVQERQAALTKRAAELKALSAATNAALGSNGILTVQAAA